MLGVQRRTVSLIARTPRCLASVRQRFVLDGLAESHFRESQGGVGHAPGVDLLTGHFWSRYVRVGRCAIDTEHKMPFIRDETRWRVEGDLRHCQWCGACKQRWHEIPRTEIITKWITEVSHG